MMKLSNLFHRIYKEISTEIGFVVRNNNQIFTWIPEKDGMNKTPSVSWTELAISAVFLAFGDKPATKYSTVPFNYFEPIFTVETTSNPTNTWYILIMIFITFCKI